MAGTFSGEPTIELWAADGQMIRRTARLPWPERVLCLAIGPDGRQLLVAGRRYIGLWQLDPLGGAGESHTVDLAAGDFSELSCSSAAIHPQGMRAVLGSNDGSLLDLELSSGRLARLVVGAIDGIIHDLEFDREGRTLFVAAWRRSPALFELALQSNPIVVKPLDADDAPRSLSLGLDGTTLYSGHEMSTVVAHSTRTGDLLWRSRVGESSIVDLCSLRQGLSPAMRLGTSRCWYSQTRSNDRRRCE